MVPGITKTIQAEKAMLNIRKATKAPKKKREGERAGKERMEKRDRAEARQCLNKA